MSDGINSVIKAFKEKNNFLVASHINPEGDSIGSLVGVYCILKRLKKNVIMVNSDNVPQNLKFLPFSNLIRRKVPHSYKANTLVILDSPVKERIGKICDALTANPSIVNIDHHISNENFGDVNWVEPKASSVGEMVFFLAKKMGIKIDRKVALSLYAAILTDTGMFNYDNTTSRTHIAVSELLEKGADPGYAYSEIFEKRPASEVRLLAKVLRTLRLEQEGMLAYMSLTKKMLSGEGLRDVSTSDFINFPRSIQNVKIVVFFKESLGKHKGINVSFRSRAPIDVNKIAAFFGGGGHMRASGCLIDCKLKEAQDKVLKEARRVLKKHYA